MSSYLALLRHKKCAKLYKRSQFTSKFITTSVRDISDGSRHTTGLLTGHEKKVNFTGFSEEDSLKFSALSSPKTNR